MSLKYKTMLGFAAAAIAAPSLAAADDFSGKLIVDARLRYENVDQDGFAKDANALTLRTRLGYETAAWRGFKGLVEGVNVAPIVDDYNSTVNRKVRFPVVSDPDITQLNRAQISYAGAYGGGVVGRQRIIVGNARFVGNVGFRQIEQTFDAVRLDLRPTKSLNITYAYLGRVHRIVGDDNVNGQWHSDSQIAQADLKTSIGTLSGYAFLLDFDNARANSNATYGARLAGAKPLSNGLSVTYAAEYAHQTDYRSSPTNFDLDYVMLSGGLKAKAPWISVNYEKLEGDGHRGFATPLATLHSYQGWADVFLTTPAGGVDDWYVDVGTTVKVGPKAWPLKLQAVAHDFEVDHGSGRYGRELDLLAGAPLNKNFYAELKAARFDGSRPGFADRTKIWATLEYKY